MKRIVIALLVVLSANAAFASCVNKFVARSEGGNKQVITLLTGKLTFQEANAIADKAVFEWVDEKGKPVARQFGRVKVVRPMPVGCDGKPSGVIMIVTFGAAAPPTKKMNVKLDATTTVEFEQQAQ
jgi:hypothetical protein